MIKIKIFCDRSCELLELSHKKCIDKGDKFSGKHCPQNVLGKKKLKNILYTLSIIKNLMYAQIYMRPDINFTV